uniref:hypothetical protein n=1 Tax=unclassified Brucella TaxID=2632610 RepID=UPI003B97D15B
YNIVPFTAPTATNGTTWTYTLPQWAAAGYSNASSNAKLQIDYMAVKNGVTTWSNLATYTLNSTI